MSPATSLFSMFSVAKVASHVKKKKRKTKLTADDSQHMISSTHYQRNFFSIAYSAGLNVSETICSMMKRIAKKFIAELTGVDAIVFQSISEVGSVFSNTGGIYFLMANFAPQTEHLPSAVIFGCSLTSAPHKPHFTNKFTSKALVAFGIP